MLKYKHIEASRELRLWIGQIIVPALTAGTMLYASNPNVRKAVDQKIEKVKRKFHSKKIKVVK